MTDIRGFAFVIGSDISPHRRNGHRFCMVNSRAPRYLASGSARLLTLLRYVPPIDQRKMVRVLSNHAVAVPALRTLLPQVRACRICEHALPLEPRPVVQISRSATILIAGQAPSRRVHETGIPFNDPSGDRLRDWMGIDRATFYDARRIATLPMGFCYPGTGANGDLPPRPECAPAWRGALLASLPRLQLIIVIGRYAQTWHLNSGRQSVTDAVRAWKSYFPRQIPLPHPSPRNQLWLKQNPWFTRDVLPALRRRVRDLL